MARGKAVLTLALPLALAIAGVGVAGPRRGKVIKVERPTNRAPREIHACQVDSFGAGPARRLTCLSGSIAVGDELDILSERGDYERVRADRVVPSRLDLCRIGEPVDVDVTSLERQGAPGRLGSAPTQRIALSGLKTIPAVSRLIPAPTGIDPPSGSSRDSVMLGVELEGDGEIDVLVVISSCEEARRRAPFIPGGRLMNSLCVDFWVRSDSGAWRRNNRELLHMCRS